MHVQSYIPVYDACSIVIIIMRLHRHCGHSYLVSLLFAAPIPTLVIFMKFLPLDNVVIVSQEHAI